jgi:hypothetical protein
VAISTIREQCDRRLEGMKGERKPYEADWEEINRLGMSSRNTNLGANGRKNTRRANTASHDSYGRRASRILGYGMQSGLSSSSMPWFKLKPGNAELEEDQDAKEWLAVAEQKIYAFFGDTGVYDPFKLNYMDLGNYGVGASVMLEHPEYVGVTHALTAGEYWIAADGGSRTDTLYRNVDYTVDSLIRTFGWDNVSSAAQRAWDGNHLQTIVPVIHAIERNHDRDPVKIDVDNKEYRSVFYEPGNDNKTQLLRKSGYDSKPFWAPRWEVIGGSVYSDACPGFDALPDLREMQLTARRRGRARDMLHKPPMKAPTGLTAQPLKLDPGSINFASATDLEGLQPVFEVQWQSLAAVRDDHEAVRRDVGECYYNDLFKAISDREGVQPLNDLEASLRETEKFTQLGPIVDRVNVEMLEVAVQRAFVILTNTGIMPEPPQSMQGQPLIIDFVSMLAQAQRASQNSAIERMARFVGFIAGTFPEAVIKFDAEQAIDEFATGTGTPPRIVRSDEVVEKMKAAMEAQKQQEQMMQMAAPMKDAAQGAELLSRTDVGGGQTALQQLTGQ